MAKLRKYYTGYCALDWWRYPKPPHKGKGWNITYSKTNKYVKSEITTMSPDKKTRKPREIIINAPSFQSAQNAFNLINSARWLFEGDLTFAMQLVRPADKEEFNKIYKGPFNQSELLNSYGASFYLPQSCIIAAKASYRKIYKYALAKYKLASNLHSMPIVDIDPSIATEHFGVSTCFDDHIHYAYSIIASYSVIEEIGLEIRATANKPSRLKNGNWNPLVKIDLEDRLKKAGVDVDITIPWVLRGKPTKIQKVKPLPSKGRCDWARGPYVRDCELKVIDAINIASFLRSKISSHKMSVFAASLSPYDVENVRNLARYLLLIKLGFTDK